MKEAKEEDGPCIELADTDRRSMNYRKRGLADDSVPTTVCNLLSARRCIVMAPDNSHSVTSCSG